MKVIFCVPTVKKPYQVMLDSIAASIPLIQQAGWEEGMVSEIGCPYISHARATMLRKALDAKADVIVFLDHDLSWKPADLLTLIETPGDVLGRGLGLLLVREQVRIEGAEDGGLLDSIAAADPAGQRCHEGLGGARLLDQLAQIVAGALAREESRGAHYRSDFPSRDDVNWLCHSLYFPGEKRVGKRAVNFTPKTVPGFEPAVRKY